MYWNHRLMKINDEIGIVEVYYNNDGSIMGWTEGFVTVYGDDVEEVKKTLAQMLSAADNPALDQEELLKERADERN